MVIAAVGEEKVRLLAWPTWFARDRTSVQIVQQRQQLGDVVAVPAGQRDRERNAAGVDE